MQSEWVSWALSVIVACGIVAAAASFILDSTPPRYGRNAKRNALLRALCSAGVAVLAAGAAAVFMGEQAFDMAADGFTSVLIMGFAGSIACVVLIAVAADLSRGVGRLLTPLVAFGVGGCAAIFHFTFTIHPALPAAVVLLGGLLTFLKVSRDRAQQRRMQEAYDGGKTTLK